MRNLSRRLPSHAAPYTRFDHSSLLLDVRFNSRAYQIWKRVGFSTFGVLDDYARFNGISFQGNFMSILVDDLLFYTKEIDQVCCYDD